MSSNDSFPTALENISSDLDELKEASTCIYVTLDRCRPNDKFDDIIDDVERTCRRYKKRKLNFDISIPKEVKEEFPVFKEWSFDVEIGNNYVVFDMHLIFYLMSFNYKKGKLLCDMDYVPKRFKTKEIFKSYCDLVTFVVRKVNPSFDEDIREIVGCSWFWKETVDINPDDRLKCIFNLLD